MRMLICSMGSKRCPTTLHFATEVAKALSAEVTLLGVADRARKVESLEGLMATVAEELAGHRLPYSMRTEVADPEEAIMAELERTPYDLVAVGALAGKRARRALLAPVGLRIVERAQNSVLLIKGDRPGVSRVLIGASGGEQGHLAVWAGAALACGAGARATLLHVADVMPAMYAGLELMEETLAELLQSDTETARELRWAAQVIKAECELAEVKLRRGVVADEILREGQEGDYDVIVLGSSRYAGGRFRALMGDVTREVVNRAQRPVLVVRPMD